VDLRLRDAEPVVVFGIGHRQVGSEVEELVLNSLERSPYSRVEISKRQGEPELRVELVYHAVGDHARVELGRARTVAEARLASVAAAGVDLGEADGLVALARAHGASLLRA